MIYDLMFARLVSARFAPVRLVFRRLAFRRLAPMCFMPASFTMFSTRLKRIDIIVLIEKKINVFCVFCVYDF